LDILVFRFQKNKTVEQGRKMIGSGVCGGRKVFCRE
jgi:hypothetical protein